MVGRVLDPDGKPVPGATVVVHARSLALGRAPYHVEIGARSRSPTPARTARAGSGSMRPGRHRRSTRMFGAVALAPGYGVGWVELDPDDDQPTADISLRPEQVIHGRLFDVQGRPVPDVTRLGRVDPSRCLPRAPGQGLAAAIDGIAYWGQSCQRFPGMAQAGDDRRRGPLHRARRGPGPACGLTVHHPRFALERIEVETDDASESKPLTAALVPAQIVNVRVTYADTGKPVPHAPLEVMASQGRVAMLDESETDAEGRLRVNPRRRTAPTASRPIRRKDSPTSLPTERHHGPRARSSSPSTSPYRAAY